MHQKNIAQLLGNVGPLANLRKQLASSQASNNTVGHMPAAAAIGSNGGSNKPPTISGLGQKTANCASTQQLGSNASAEAVQ